MIVEIVCLSIYGKNVCKSYRQCLLLSKYPRKEKKAEKNYFPMFGFIIENMKENKYN